MDLRDYMAILGRRRWLVLFVASCTVGLVGLYSFTRTPVYTAKTEILVRPVVTSAADFAQGLDVNVDTEIQVVDSAAVAQLAKQKMGSPLSALDLLKHVSVTVPQNTEVIEISYSDPDPRTAQRGAQAFADSYLEFKTQQAIDASSSRTAALQEQIREIDGQTRDLNREIASLTPNTAEWKDKRDQLDLLQSTRLILQNQMITLTTATIDPGQVIQPAALPASPSSPKHAFDLTLGVLLGLLLGVAAASLRERLDDRVRGPSTLEACLHAPVLGLIPREPGSRRKAHSRLVTVEEPKSVASEAYRTLRTSIQAMAGRPGLRSVLVTSAQAGEGKTTTAVNLATVTAQLGKRVVLISADLRRPRVHRFFGTDSDDGLSTVLAGKLQPLKALQKTSIENLRVVPSGPLTTDMEPVELLQSERMLEFLAQCSMADFVVIDAPPVLTVADSLVLAELVDGVLIVADARSTRAGAVIQARHQLDRIGARVLGGVLNNLEPSKTDGRYYGPYDYRRGLMYRLFVRPQSDGRPSPERSGTRGRSPS